MENTMRCESCGRDVSRLIKVKWECNSVKQKYNVCVSCNNGFAVCVTDHWAREIANIRTISDGDKKYPPLICGESYKDAYKD